jgi:hypothetical protein
MAPGSLRDRASDEQVPHRFELRFDNRLHCRATNQATNRAATPPLQVSRTKINELLRESHQRFTPLQRLLRQAANQESWTAQLRALLPDSLQRDCQVMQVRGGTVVVACRNAASATKLRFLIPELLPRLAELSSFHGTRKIRIRVSAEER